MPEYELSVDLPNRPKDDPVEVFPFGVVPNGKSIKVEMTADEAKAIDGPSVTVKKSSKGGDN
jgi:hypothetical protein